MIRKQFILLQFSMFTGKNFPLHSIMFSEKDFERLCFLYKTERNLKVFPSTSSALVTIFFTQDSMTGSGKHIRRL